MKVQGNVTRKQTIEGTLSKEDLLSLVKANVAVPPEAEAQFFVYAPGELRYGVAGQLSVSSAIYVDSNVPLRFRITWSLPVGKDEQG